MAVACGSRQEANSGAPSGEAYLLSQLRVLAVDDLVPYVEGGDLQEGSLCTLRDASQGFEVAVIGLRNHVEV